MPDLLLTTIQTSLFWEDKEANLRMFDTKIRAIDGPAELVLLPEMFSTGFSMNPSRLAEKMDGPTINWMRSLANQKRIILCGSVIIEEEGRYFNRLVWVLPTGELGYYDKRHLFAYAGEDQHYQAGEKRFIASVKGWKINLQVCYDLRFPVWARQNKGAANEADPEYDLLIYLANWPERRSHAWKTLLQARAIENQCYVVGVNRIGLDGNGILHSGDSLVADPLGNLLYTASDKEEVNTLSLSRHYLKETRNRLPFLKDGDRFFIEP